MSSPDPESGGDRRTKRVKYWQGQYKPTKHIRSVYAIALLVFLVVLTSYVLVDHVYAGGVANKMSSYLSHSAADVAFDLHKTQTYVRIGVNATHDATWHTHMADDKFIAVRAKQFQHGHNDMIEVLLNSSPLYRKALFKEVNWVGEYASYHVDRILGINAVPVAVHRSLVVKDAMLQNCISGCEWPLVGRNPKDHGIVSGALLQFVDGLIKLQATDYQPCAQPQIHPTENHTMVYGIQYHALEGRRWRWLATHKPKRVQCKRNVTLALSDLAVFDHIVAQEDRWRPSGAIYNLHATLHGQHVHLDNERTFGQRDINVIFKWQVFRKSTVKTLRKLMRPQPTLATTLRKRILFEVGTDILTAEQYEDLNRRAMDVLAHISVMEEKFGANTVLLDD